MAVECFDFLTSNVTVQLVIDISHITFQVGIQPHADMKVCESLPMVSARVAGLTQGALEYVLHRLV